MKTSSDIRRRLLLAALLLVAFAAGAVAQRTANGVTMQGKVMDANTVAEPIEYWEIRSATGESVVVTGKNDLPLVRWLRQSRNRSVVIRIESSPDAVVTVPPR